ncbi:lipocalin-like domain-containing protein [Photobacterium sp.]|uniref:lipocalin-like domain-containing protein n=1 Tax=Photobacterium sp. TaxID=660 RepID=UPI00299E1FA9|nr:lipocalin-like domain-containing protein [Photobacterium sp.]MDX1301679.1 lipocalin-like domain-containing protein [Photobacterium sp.]
MPSILILKVKEKQHWWVTSLLILLLLGCEQAEERSTTAEQLTQVSSDIYQPVVEGHQLRFPRDFSSHPGFRMEWWYLTANLEDENGETFGVQWTLFRLATGTESDGGWKTPQMFMAHVVVTSAEKNWFAERFARGGIGQAGVMTKPYRAWLDNWSWRSLGQSPFPGLLEFQDGDMAARLQINNQGSIVLQGKDGYSRKHRSENIASYYYSAPFLKVDGTLELDGKLYKVKGDGWYDREWSSTMLAQNQQGWDWFSIHLDDGSALMLYQIREKNRQPFYFGTLSWPDGKVVQLGPEDIQLTPLGYTSVAGKSLPLDWRIDVPSQQIELRAEVVRKEQWLPFTFPYWEGPIKVKGSHSGQGFMELTGY